MKATLWRIVGALALAATLLSCGGGQEQRTGSDGASRLGAALTAAMGRANPPSAAADAGSARRTAAGAAFVTAAAATGADPDAVEAAEQLMDFAEASFAGYFPGRGYTSLYEGYLFRFYAATGAYLGVRDGQVYVLGGPFGEAVQPVGALTQFISPVPSKRDPCGRAGAPAYALHASALPALGRSAGAAVAGCSTTIRSPSWRQTGGPAVALLSERSQAISFDPQEAGSYSFELSFTDDQGRSQRESVTITVPHGAAPTLGITARVHHAVRTGGKVSLRAWPRLPEGETLKSVSWQQLEGPAVVLDAEGQDDHLASFNAPAVTRDTLLKLRATVLTVSGRSASDDVHVLVERHAQASASNEYALWGGDHVSRVYPYRAGSPYAADMVGCVYNAATMGYGPSVNLCTLGKLPFVAQNGASLPSIEQVMDRVLVSHDWMGRNFEAFLRTHDTRGDFRRMLRSVTAVVIGSHVRPSFYMPATGTIYLDADTFWLTPEERDTVNEAPDYRSAFGKTLKYDDLWRYVKDNQTIFKYNDPRARVTRTLDEVHPQAAQLLYHELGHALDYLPPEDYRILDNRLSAWANLWPRYSRYGNASDVVAGLYPLTATEMFALADVRYRGVEANATQIALTPEQVGELFGADRATDPYSYSTNAEDTAMLVEEFLMQHRLGIPRDLAFTAPITDDDTSRTILVRWGQRGRAGEPALRERTREAVRQLLPWVDLAEVDALPAPQALRIGESWYDNLTPAAAGARRQALAALPAQARDSRAFRQEWRRMQRGHCVGGARSMPAHGTVAAGFRR